jgi:hypothetical protein
MERLVAIIPQPRTHHFLYYGVFAEECVRSPDSYGIQEKKWRAKRGAKYHNEILPKYRRVREKSKSKVQTKIQRHTIGENMSLLSEIEEIFFWVGKIPRILCVI